MITNVKTVLTTRRPMAFGYARVSDPKQIKQDDSVPFQSMRIENYYRLVLGDQGVDWGGIIADPKAVSAFKKEFGRRKAGAKIMELVQPGDHVIIDKVDRLARCARDMHNMLYWFEQHQVRVHILGLLGQNVDLDTPIGKFMVGIFGLCAEWESHVRSERTNERNKVARKLGRAQSNHPLLGTYHTRRWSRGVRKIYIKWDIGTRAIMQQIVRWHEEDKLNFNQISRRIEQHLAQKNGRIWSDSAFYPLTWGSGKCCLAYWTERFYRDHNIKEVTELPVSAHRSIKQYKRECQLIED